jgi:hypothetical protein
MNILKLLAISGLACVLTTSLMATNATLTYSTNGMEVTVTGRSSTGAEDVVIPATNEDGYAVVAIGDSPNFSADNDITSIDLTGATNLTYIGEFAFSDCDGVTGTLTIPDSVTNLAQYCFNTCPQLTDLIISTNSQLIIIGDRAFQNCYSFQNHVVIPSNVTYVGADCFNGSASIPSFTFLCPTPTVGSPNYGYVFVVSAQGYYYDPPNTYTDPFEGLDMINLGGYTGPTLLTYSTNNTEVTVTGYSDIGNGAVIIPATNSDGLTVVAIGDNAFASDPDITSLDMSGASNLGFIGSSAFYLSGLTNVGLTIPSSVTTISSSAFQSCTGITGNLDLGSVVTIGSSAFDWCKGFTGALVLPNSVTGTLGDDAFSACIGFTSLSIGTGITSIDFWAFIGCTGLVGNLTIPNSVTNIGDSAFKDCTSLTDALIFESGVAPTIGTDVFSGTAFTNLVVGESDNGIVGGWQGSSSYIATFTGTLVLGPAVTGIGLGAFSSIPFSGNLTIPSTVTHIDTMAFSGCSFSGGSLDLGSGLTNIAASAFSGCGFAGGLNIPNSVLNIDQYAFDSCYNLDGALSFGNSVTNIGYSAFSSCGDLGNFSPIAIPDSVIRIGEYAFYGVFGITGLTLGSGVSASQLTTIGQYAFADAALAGTLIVPNKVTSIGDYAFTSSYVPFQFTLLSVPQSLTSIGTAALGAAEIQIRPNITTPNATDVKLGTVYGANTNLTGTLVSGSGEVIHGF